MRDPAFRTPNAFRQFRTLIGLWWRHVRRRPTRLGEAPKVAGTPAFLLIGAITTAYMTMITWQSVVQNVKEDPACFSWHALGVLLLGFATGLTKGGGRLQVRGTRNDAFLDPLPLRSLARLGLQLADTLALLPVTFVGALAAHSVHGRLGLASLPASVLGSFAFVSFFALGVATLAWARALGPATAGRWGGYLGVALTMVAMVALVLPLGRFRMVPDDALSARFARAWIGPESSLPLLYAVVIVLGVLGVRGLLAAERYGFDQLDPQLRTPKPPKRARDRLALERVMMLRHGGAALLILYGVLMLGAGTLLGALYASAIKPPRKLLAQALLFATGFIVYLGSIQTIGQAGRAARADQQARSFLSALPISPHQVLEGKTRALRMLLIPVLSILALLAASSWTGTDGRYTYRIVLSLVGLFVIVEGAVSIAFLSTGIGVIGLGGSHTTGFSTQILLLPLFATVLAPNDWAATTAFIAVAAITFESRRAARLNVRWLDDPADDLQRETTVWRALLAAAAFFAMQGLSFQILRLFEMPSGYALALAFASSSVMLALLTWRNDARTERPRFLPGPWWAWPLGIGAGIASGLLAREFGKLVPPPGDVSLPEFSSGELAALAVMMTVVAPLVEEYFFRGWLQRAVAADLPADKKHWAFALGAFAFALAHFGTYGVPQLVLGLLAGWLYARSGGLWPSIVAHALHNGVVLWLES